MATVNIINISDEQELIKGINESTDSSKIVSTTLKTDERVIARVTDGIYRQPGSALRELISNAYDADAKRVVIKTDYPKFERITVEDDGHGMNPETLAHLLHHIGGSAKRNDIGKHLGVTSSLDPSKSPSGRKLVGKIGIGLFSVSQLTHSFQVITKEKGSKYRTIATVVLRQFSEDNISSDSEDKFESGKVNIWREAAVDIDSHGTTIVLTSIRPQARDTLRSRDIWAVIEQSEEDNKENSENAIIAPPKYHIGRVDPSSSDLLKKTANKFDSLPWTEDDTPELSFKKLVDQVWAEVDKSNPNPKLEELFDYYLRMVWQLALAVPLPYIEGNLFDLKLANQVDLFELSNLPKGSAKSFELENTETIRQKLKLSTQETPLPFEVFFDDLKLFRPLKYQNLPTSGHALKKPIVFVGNCREEFSKSPIELSGGPLEFEAYLFWNPKIAPTEHRGSLIRIHGSSGTLFDPTFMKYQISEQTRLSQITCEIFIKEGLDSALNIDRESFNFAHPHSVYLTKWLHGALRQLATAQKKLASAIRDANRDESKKTVVTQIQKVVNDAWIVESDDPASSPPGVEITNDEDEPTSNSYAFSRSLFTATSTISKGVKSKSHQEILEVKLKAIAQLLASFGLLDKLSQRKRETLLKAIFKILDTSED